MFKRNRNQRRRAGARRPSHTVHAPGRWRRLAVTAAALAATATALGALARHLDQPIDRLTVVGRLQHVTASGIERVVRADLHGAGLLTVDLDAIDHDLAALPWVEHATVQRTWPRALTVRIVEQRAAAHWNDSGLLNARGELFLSDAQRVPLAAGLPRLYGPDGAQAQVMARYLAMQGRLETLGMHLASLTEDARGAWHFTLGDGVQVRLGRSAFPVRFGRFVHDASRILRRNAGDVADVDMRYSHGFAVRWKHAPSVARRAARGVMGGAAGGVDRRG